MFGVSYYFTIKAYLTDFLPYFITTNFFLEAKCQVEVFPFRPHYQCFLLFLVGCIRLDFGFKKQRT